MIWYSNNENTLYSKHMIDLIVQSMYKLVVFVLTKDTLAQFMSQLTRRQPCTLRGPTFNDDLEGRCCC